MTSLRQARLYGILDLAYLPASQLESVTSAVLEGGAGLLQLRAKDFPKDQIATWARRILPLCRSAGVPLLINDYPDLALQVEADGVHLGQDDASAVSARQLLGPERLIGLSTHSLAQARAAALQPIDYIGFGPLFATPTKPEYPPIGLQDIATVHQEVSLPIFCIGGIKLENLPQVLAAGARRAVIVSGILQAPDITRYVRTASSLLRAATHLDALA